MVMECPWVGDVVSSAIKKCPFLSQLAADRGEEYATSIAINPTRPAPAPVLPESLTDFRASFSLFHGASGVVPLVNRDVAPVVESRCPFRNTRSQTDVAPSSAAVGLRPTTTAVHGCPNALSAAPFASLSSGVLRFFPGPGDFIARRRRKRQERQHRRAEKKANSSRAGGADRADTQRPGLEKWRTHPLVGGLIPLNAAGRYVCPPLVMAGRQAVARWRSVQILRPQSLPVKLLGVGGHCALANIPCGAVREHTEKFSVAWFVAVHATVPFFAFMRKGVGMPKWAILLTLASAILGQTIGSRLERSRMEIEATTRRQMEEHVRQLHLSPQLTVRQGCPLLRTCGELAGDPTSSTRSVIAV